MKIKLPKPVSRDPNALDAKSRKSAGPFRSNKPRQKARLSDFDDEIVEAFVCDGDCDYCNGEE
jgi:hypothetical protein